ncbi:transposase [Virgibacillus natechei]|uniref:transposase n=1 Tax=Virgibacillus natechei TaxID=1216297 RepID=UPI00223077E8|nr:transposase [Virgibacillus natechei]UZD12275.1 transposase [Virgibacillus natechei]UZD12339.1 transposase [Virgibacillus natechei]UZD12349.1 transposase [Virgibacillus natechei]UZD12897.1 transposase [Virgibacillus natechei]UZD12908.1 transposase [Virgibacillus natechei]
MTKQKRYSKEFKNKVVQYYNDNPGLGYLSLARFFDISSDESVRRWVKEKQSRGDEAFTPIPKNTNTKKKNTKRKTNEISTDRWEDPQESNERIAFLEAENAYLKKLIALRKGDSD